MVLERTHCENGSKVWETLRSQVVNTRPAGRIQPSTSFYPAQPLFLPGGSAKLLLNLHLYSPKITFGPLKATARLMWPRVKMSLTPLI